MISKFRAWNKKTKEWTYFDVPSDFFFDGCTTNIDDFENWCEFTGLKDKNEKEIYKGDIIKNANGIYMKIYWNELAAGFWQTTCSKKNVQEKGYEWNPARNTRMDLSMNEKEIIGDIYQNPELIK